MGDRLREIERRLAFESGVLPAADGQGTLIPKDKLDTDAVARLVVEGYPAIHPLLPDLLAWMQDINCRSPRPCNRSWPALAPPSRRWSARS